MPTSRNTRRKRYRPRMAVPVAGFTALLTASARIEDTRPLSDGQVTDLAAAYWLALDAMVRGTSGEEEWSVVTCALNIALVLAEQGIGLEYERDFIAALDGAFRAKLRAEQKGSWRFDGEALQAIRTALALHDQQIVEATKVQLRAAMLEVHRRIDAGCVYEAVTRHEEATT